MSIIKEQILKYKELKPNIGYHELSMTFGLPLDKLFEVMGITNYKIRGSYFEVYDNNGNEIYYENSNGGWGKWEYDSNGKKMYYEDSYGYKTEY